ncbi:VOC family protein [Rhodohalobacter sp. SW132]|uniref:VOC family protein n=1 Tax=Rhodohalobacter sp. SW132 TaxID=2293433 RepID=UPI000E25F394|nr:VOC family protein [Rhodohalobacter sp. SW132]REL33169.1 VOC family protein [Rhodohalobacter sp. SW132]
MKIEHFAINVEEPEKMADWYIEHVGLEAVSRKEKAPFTSFLADDSGDVMLEIYKNPPDNIPDYHQMDPLNLHLAFVSDDPDSDKKRLVNAGAALVSEDHLEDGSHIVMLKDPWGISIQLCKRGVPMLKPGDHSH